MNNPMWKDVWENHKGKTLGLFIGFLLAIVYLGFGFWDMLVFGFVILVGFYVGMKIDKKEPVFDWGPLYRWMTERFRMFK